MSAADEIWNAAQMQAMAEQLHKQVRAVLGIETFIDTAPVLPCGCRGACGGHPLPPALGMPEGRTYKHGEPHLPLFAFGLTAAEIVVAPEQHEIRETDGRRQHLVNGEVCGCTAPPSAPPGAHGLTCPVFTHWLGTRDGRRYQELARPAAPHDGGHPRTDCARLGCTQDPPGIPLWDEAKHAALAEMSGPMTLPESQLPRYDVVPPGCCTGCHLPVPAGATTCHYCDLAKQQDHDAAMRVNVNLKTLAVSPAKTCDHGSRMQCPACYPRPRLRVRAYPFFLLGLALTLFVAGLHLGPWLCLVAVFFAASGLYRIRRQL